MRIAFALCCAMTLVAQAWSQDRATTTTLSEVVVTGEQPGPQLWKLTRDGHVLWILATVTPKPRDITWRSQQVADVLNDTQEVINQAVNIELDLKSFNPLTGLRAARAAEKARNQLPPTPPLQEVVPADIYARFANLKARYLPNDLQIEKLRPRLAANRLYLAAIDANGLSLRAMIHEEVHKLARRRRVDVNNIVKVYEFDFESRIAVEMEFAEIPPTAELPCFLETLNDLEVNLPVITERANAWATGDVDKLRKLPLLRRDSCNDVYWSAPRWSELQAELDAFWLETVETAVKKNKSTLVMLDMAELLESNGLLAILGQRGFEIEGP